MKHLNDGITFAKPHLTVTQLRHRTKINPKTLDRHLNKMEKQQIVIRYGLERPKPGQRYKRDPRFPTFYRLNPETDGEVKFCMWKPGVTHPQFLHVNHKSKRSWYTRMQDHRRRGKVVYYTITQGIIVAKKFLSTNSH